RGDRERRGPRVGRGRRRRVRRDGRGSASEPGDGRLAPSRPAGLTGAAGEARPARGSRAMRGSRTRRPQDWLRAFWHRAYRENITGMAAMVAYNLALALFPFALLVLFIFGQVLGSGDIEESVVNDLQGIFPAVEQDELERAIE